MSQSTIMIVTNVLWISSCFFLYQVDNAPLPEVTGTLQTTSLRPQGNNITLTRTTSPPLATETVPKSFPTFPWPIRNFSVLVTFVNLTQKLPMMLLKQANVEEFRQLFAEKLEVEVECLSASNDIHFTYGGKPMKVNKRDADLPPNNDVTLQFEMSTDKYENCEMLKAKLNSSGPLKLFGKSFYPTIVVWEDNSTFESFSSEIQTSKSSTKPQSTNKLESFNVQVHNTPLPAVTDKAPLKNTSLQSQGNNITFTKAATTPAGEKTDTTPSVERKTSQKSFPTFSWPIRNFNVLLTFVNITQKLPMVLLDRKSVEDFRKSIAEKLEVDVECVANRSDIQFTYEGEPMKIDKRSAEAPPNNDATLQFDVTTDKYENSEILRKKLEAKSIKLFKQVFHPTVLVWEDISTSQTQTTYSLSSNHITETKLQTAEQRDLISTQGSTQVSTQGSTQGSTQDSTQGSTGMSLKPSTFGTFQTNFHTIETPALPTTSSNVDKKNNFSPMDLNQGGIILIYLLTLLLVIPVTISIVVGVYCCLRILKKKKPDHLHPVERLETFNFYQPPLGDRPPTYQTNPWSNITSKMDAMTTKESLVSLDQKEKEEEIFYDSGSSSNYSRNSSVNNFQKDAADENF